MEIKINPDNENPKTLRALAQFLIKISESKGKFSTHLNNQENEEENNQEPFLKNIRPQDMFAKNPINTQIPSQGLGSASEGMFSLFDSPLVLGESLNNIQETSKINSSLNLSNSNSDHSKSDLENNDNPLLNSSSYEKNEMIYDINEFFY